MQNRNSQFNKKKVKIVWYKMLQLPHSFLIPWQEQKTTTQNCEMETQTSEEKFRIANLELELCGEKTSELWNKKIAVTFFQFLIPWRKTELREVRILWEKVSILSLHLPILTFFPLIVRKSRNYLLLIFFLISWQNRASIQNAKITYIVVT